MKVFVSSIMLLALLLQNCYAQDTNIIKYLPLKVGNVWVYRCSSQGFSCYCTKNIKIKVINSVVYNSKTYFVSEVTNYLINCYGTNCYTAILSFQYPHRVDSITGNVLVYYSTGGCNYSPNEIMIDSFKAKFGDTIKTNCNTSNWKYVCTDTNSANIFGALRNARKYTELQFESYYNRRYAKGIGLISSDMGGMNCNNNSYLLGCVIDGIVYGDTSTITSITEISNEIPDNFSLSQNYPNPFNPVTKITFAIPPSKGARGMTQLIIYDILGREIATLVNEQLQPGTYETAWDGSNFSSGIYYYCLVTNEFNETKKMVLIK
jgi:hypothetical protein